MKLVFQFLALFVATATFWAQVEAQLPNPGPNPDPFKSSTTKQPNSQTKSQTIIVTPKSIGKSHHDVMDEIESSPHVKRMESREERNEFIYASLKAAAVNSQQGVLSFLDQEKTKNNKLDVTPMWISSQIIVRNADDALIMNLKNRPDVASVKLDETYSMRDAAQTMMRNMNITAQWGVRQIEAMRVWWGGGNNVTNFTTTTSAPSALNVTNITTSSTSRTTRMPFFPFENEENEEEDEEIYGNSRSDPNSGTRGEGIRVGVIDTGVNVKHEALRDNFIGTNGWFEPQKRSQEPNDGHGHGTHTTGTICGRANGIGVAPGARWMACKGCDEKNGCELSNLLLCGQFMACPHDYTGNTNTCNVSLIPHLVSNSWGGRGGNMDYVHIIRVWREKGIIPIFAAGNSGPLCGTMASPADNPDVITVGSTSINNKTNEEELSPFSSRGPTYIGARRKPDIVAPGGDVVSAVHNQTDMYIKMSGTSMACPHVSGVVALMLSKNPDLKYADILDRLQNSAEPVDPASGRLAVPGINKDCGAISETKYPNNQLGYGRVNARKAVFGN